MRTDKSIREFLSFDHADGTFPIPLLQPAFKVSTAAGKSLSLVPVRYESLTSVGRICTLVVLNALYVPLGKVRLSGGIPGPGQPSEPDCLDIDDVAFRWLPDRALIEASYRTISGSPRANGDPRAVVVVDPVTGKALLDSPPASASRSGSDGPRR